MTETKEQLIIVRNSKELNDLIEYLRDPELEFVSYDTETTGVDKGAQIIGMSVCASLDKAYYVILAYWDKDKQSLISLNLDPKPLLKVLETKSLIMQNAGFDIMMTEANYGISLMNALHTDTLVLGHLLDENRSNGLKERGIELFGEDAAEEQRKMKESVIANGGVLTKQLYELYKADADLIAYYGAKDALLTLKIFYHDVPLLYEQGLDKFFYEDESMPLLKGATYDLNTTGLRVDMDRLKQLKAELEADIAEAEAFIYKEVDAYVKHKYPGTGKSNHFNVDSNQQLAWLLYGELGEEFTNLTDAGKDLCNAMGIKLPYTRKAKYEFIQLCLSQKDNVWAPEGINSKTKKVARAKKIREPWAYIQVGKEALQGLAKRYRWVARLLECKKNRKLLSTYVEGIEERVKYGIIRPSFLQIGTTSGRYSSKNPNFQNLPRDDKRVKSCIVSRPGKVFVGADQAQLEPRCFASSSGDERLRKCFADGDDFYSVIGIEVFNKQGCSPKADEPNSFKKLYPDLRQIAKVVPLAVTYGAGIPQIARITGLPKDEVEGIIQSYFKSFPKVRQLMLDSHKEAKTSGQVVNAYGRPRRLPKAKLINQMYPGLSHAELPSDLRGVLNLSVNHKVQSTGASIMNRSAIAVHREIVARGWKDVKIVMQVHDELILEAPEALASQVAEMLKRCMEQTVELPGVKLLAEPKIANNLADLK